MDGFAPWARIAARYGLGALMAGSGPLGQQFAVDPEVIALTAAALMGGVETWYAWAKRKGWSV